jgi:hypothetical protein
VKAPATILAARFQKAQTRFNFIRQYLSSLNNTLL